VVYYFGPEAERLSSSLLIDMSTVISEALYVRASAVFDGTKPDVRTHLLNPLLI
jgi:hypothetical protein